MSVFQKEEDEKVSSLEDRTTQGYGVGSSVQEATGNQWIYNGSKSR